MANQKSFLIALVCGLSVASPLTSCDSNPSRIATGDEIETAVRNAEALMVEARAKGKSDRSSPPTTAQLGPL